MTKIRGKPAIAYKPLTTPTPGDIAILTNGAEYIVQETLPGYAYVDLKPAEGNPDEATVRSFHPTGKHIHSLLPDIEKFIRNIK
jgi:hypothetical protein